MNVDPAVLARLKRLDPKLTVSWSQYVIDPDTHQPVEMNANGRPVHDPHFYLWVDCPDGRTRLVNIYAHFGHREVAKLEADLLRHGKSPGEILAIVAGVRDKIKQSRESEFKQTQRDKIAANKSRIHDLVFNGKRGVRQGKAFSAPGLEGRGTPGDVMMDAKEDGWELPADTEVH